MKASHALMLSVALLSAGAAQAQFQKPEDAVKYRQSALSVMGTHFSRLGAMANGKVPFDAQKAQEDAAVVLMLSRLPWAGFTPESQKLDSKAKPELWSETGKFKAGADKLVSATVALDAAARTGSLDAVKKSFGEAAASCKACHDSYKSK
ncbi:c-type cytochrome [Malikia granosa]|jgi:cytochrome c556|uniref:Cytochrome C n=1 Tax=Malikia granosa TaxID=263067 RepID=A0A2S9K4L1_9BURK|nr:cytochrome c [Malikia granosa]PRD65399.1 cytochrome C [Malikia granosa]